MIRRPPRCTLLPYRTPFRSVIISFPPYKYEGGHLVVVTGGNAEFVYLADSSLYDRHVLTHAQFLQWWGGFSAIDRKSTRLNSSHQIISYAVFCLQKKITYSD